MLNNSVTNIKLKNGENSGYDCALVSGVSYNSNEFLWFIVLKLVVIDDWIKVIDVENLCRDWVKNSTMEISINVVESLEIISFQPVKGNESTFILNTFYI